MNQTNSFTASSLVRPGPYMDVIHVVHEVTAAGNGTLSRWGRLDRLHSSLRTAKAFFRARLQKRTMTVPGHYLDLNSGRTRAIQHVDDSWVRFSFRPNEANMRMGLQCLHDMTAEAA